MKRDSERGEFVRWGGQLEFGEEPFGRRGLAVDTEALSDQATPAAAADQPARTQMTAADEFDRDAALVLFDTGHLETPADRRAELDRSFRQQTVGDR